MSAWDTLNELGAYRITEIPRRPAAEAVGPARPAEGEPGDTGRTQRLAALLAAYHAGAQTKGNGAGALAVGWIRHGEAGPVQVLTAGPGLVGSGTGQEAFLTLPGGARARPLPRGALAGLMAQLPSWRAIGGISDGCCRTRDLAVPSGRRRRWKNACWPCGRDRSAGCSSPNP